jgi:hypothetical protein
MQAVELVAVLGLEVCPSIDALSQLYQGMPRADPFIRPLAKQVAALWCARLWSYERPAKFAGNYQKPQI